ncbi:MAG TPA: PQQ-binding-like beta-propeller repeat protein [Ilumatobacter sp.]|nr:PQQ-binding-like beta-propeller repeat protein [Ilumatobacter sp.]
MTALDREASHPGYYPSPWPVECAGNRRQKHARGRLDAAARTPRVVTARNDRWNVMVVRRDPGEWFIAGTMPAFVGDPPHGWVARVDPETLAFVAESPRLPCGDHVWCGAVAVHANGSLYNVNGNFVHRLGPALDVQAEVRLPVDGAHNGLLVLADGTIVTKDLRLGGQGPSTFTRLTPELELVHAPLELPEPSMGRIAADLTAEGEAIYVPGETRLFRLWVEADDLRLDLDWQPEYRAAAGPQGMAWDTCLSAGRAWFLDNGDLTPVRTIFDSHPNGRVASESAKRLTWQQPAPWSGAQRLVTVDLATGEVRSVAPFGTPGGGVMAPPVHVPGAGVTVCWDTVNGGMAAVDDTTLEVRWRNDIRPTMQPVVFADSGEVVINDFTGHDEVVVLDAATGEVVSRVDVQSPLANGMFLTAGDDHDVWYVSTLAVARIAWE